MLSSVSSAPTQRLSVAKRIVVIFEDDQYLALQGFKGLRETDGNILETIFLSYMSMKNVPKIGCKEEKYPDCARLAGGSSIRSLPASSLSSFASVFGS